MKKIWEGPLSEVESAIADNWEILIEGGEECIEQEDGYMITAQSYKVKIAELHIYCKEGTFFIQNDLSEDYEADFDLTLVYEEDKEDTYLYWEQDGIVTTLANFFHDKNVGPISDMQCELWAEEVG